MAEELILSNADPQQVAALQSEMRRRAAVMGKGRVEVVRKTSFFVARALAAATRLGAKRRRVVKNPEFDPDGDQRVAKWAIKRFHGQGEITLIPVKAETRDQARSDPRARIRRAGLGRAAWFWIIRDVGGRAPAARVPRTQSAFRVIKRFTPGDAEITMTSRLDYAARAFKSKGRATVADVAGRAAGSLRNETNRLIDREITRRR